MIKKWITEKNYYRKLSSIKFSSVALSTQIIIAMLLGLGFGALQNSSYDLVEYIAKGFVLLMQMTAIPYISLSLIVGIGGLAAHAAKRGLKVSLVIILSLTSLMLAFIFITPLAFPEWQHAAYYSASPSRSSAEYDWLATFIPSNPFNALSNGIVPAVVVFSIFLGIGIINVKGKDKTLKVLSDLLASIYNVNTLVMKVAPIGVFCIAFRAMVTLQPTDFDGLIVFLLSSVVTVFFIGFLLLPAMVSIFTPFGYREVLNSFRQAMVTAFATGSFLIVIPIITEKVKILLSESSIASAQISRIPNIAVPITFSLPVGGKLLGLLFVAFAAWFSGIPLDSLDYGTLAVLGLPQLFASPAVAMPALLNIFNLPSSLYDLYLLSDNLLIGRLNAALTVVFACCFSLLIATVLTESLRVNWRKLLFTLVSVFVIGILVLLTLRYSFEAINYQYNGYKSFIDRDLVRYERNAKYVQQPEPEEAMLYPNLSVLQRVEKRGFIRVGYFRDDLPYAFKNNSGDLVGFDIEIVHMLAQDLKTDIEFVLIYRKEATALLSSGYLDMTTGMPVLPDNMRSLTFSAPHSTQRIAFIVKKNRRAEFIRWQDIIDDSSLLLAIPETFFYHDAIKRNHFKSTIWEITSPRLFFSKKYKDIDGMLYGAASGSAWTLLYPDYMVIEPTPLAPEVGMAFPINTDDVAFELFMRNWIEMKQRDTSIEALFQYWIEGQSIRSFLPTRVAK